MFTPEDFLLNPDDLCDVAASSVHARRAELLHKERCRYRKMLPTMMKDLEEAVQDAARLQVENVRLNIKLTQAMKVLKDISEFNDRWMDSDRALVLVASETVSMAESVLNPCPNCEKAHDIR